MAGVPRYTFKDYSFQLVTITAGVLIALSVDAVVEWRQHRSLVEEARTMIAREIEDNRKDLAAELASVEKRNANLGEALKLANDLLTTRRSKINEFTLEMNMASLDSASWHTAERTGALSYMEYSEVKKYSEVYALQEIFTAQQRRAMQSLTATLPIAALGDPHKASPKDLDAFRTHLLATMSELYAEAQLGGQLLKGYDAALR